MTPEVTLDELPSDAHVFADATVFIYHFYGVSDACRRFLERCDRGELKVATSVVAIAEASHRLMMMEAVSEGLVSSGNVAKKLRKRPGVVKKLQAYQENVELIPLMRVEVLPLDWKVLSLASELRTTHGLMVNDSVLASTAISGGFTLFATADQDFRRVGELSVVPPGDLLPRSEL